MKLGTSILASALFLGFVALFIATRNQWNWMKIIKKVFYSVCVLTLIIGVIAGGVYFWNTWPKKEHSYIGINLGDTKQDVLFKYGNPNKYSTDNDWFYELNREEFSDNRVSSLGFGVNFEKDKVRFISFNGTSKYKLEYGLQGIYLEDSIDKITKVFGNKYELNSTKDGKNRIYIYPKYNLFFVLHTNEIYEMGVFDSKTGPVKFVDEGGIVDKKYPKFYMFPTIQNRKSTINEKEIEGILNTSSSKERISITTDNR